MVNIPILIILIRKNIHEFIIIHDLIYDLFVQIFTLLLLFLSPKKKVPFIYSEFHAMDSRIRELIKFADLNR